jgi:hypothetical protein
LGIACPPSKYRELNSPGREPQADAAVSALARFFCNHSRRFKDIIDGAVDPSDVRLRPNVRLDGVTLSEIEQKWAHAQNDALGYFLWLYCQRVATKSITADAAMLEMFVLYFERIEYWRDPDSGHWEEARKVEASRIGPVVAGLIQLRRLHDNKLVAASGRPALSPDRLGALIAKGQDALKGLLPWESLGPPDERARRYDAALLFLVYPLGVVDRTMADTICEDVATHLQGDFGIKRYLGDSYWTEDYKDKLPPSERTADFSDRQKERDALAVPGMEAQWCIFDPILSAIWGQRYEKTKSSADLRRQIHFFNRSLGQITEGSRPQDNLKCPEAYYVQHGKHVPNDNVPLLWTQANLLTAFIWMQKSAAVQAGARI